MYKSKIASISVILLNFHLTVISKEKEKITVSKLYQSLEGNAMHSVFSAFRAKSRAFFSKIKDMQENMRNNNKKMKVLTRETFNCQLK